MTDSTLTQALEEQAASEETNDEANEAQEHEDYLASLVGEGKKYKDAAELARAYVNADRHIHELREDLDKTKAKADLSEEVRQILEAQRGNTGEVAEERTEKMDKPSHAQEISTEDIAKVVDEHLDRRTTQQKQAENVNSTLETLTKHYGSKTAALNAVRKACNGDDQVKSSIDQLSMHSPDAAVRFITGTVPRDVGESNTPGLPGGSANTAVPSTGNGLTWSECRRIRQEEPKKYKSREFQQQIEKAVLKAQERGQDFFAT